MAKTSTASSTTIASLTRKLSYLSVMLGSCLTSTIAPSLAQSGSPVLEEIPTHLRTDITTTVRVKEIENKRVTLRVQTHDKAGKAISNLQADDFTVKVDGVRRQIERWLSAKDTESSPAYIIVLVDVSGSMSKPASPNNPNSKLQAATIAIQTVIDRNRNRQNTQFAIVPFAAPGLNCAGAPVGGKDQIDHFVSANDAKFQDELSKLSRIELCGATDLYTPLSRSLQFLMSAPDTPEGKRFSPRDEPKPKLSVILLSDGYHSTSKGAKEEQEFKALKQLLNRARDNNITVHTLGYGLTPEELGNKYCGGKTATRELIHTVSCLGLLEEEFVDRDRLQDIARLTNGIAEFSGSLEQITQRFTEFLEAIQGEYELQYVDNQAERGSKHRVSVIVAGAAPSAPYGYTMPVWGALPRPLRVLILSGTIAALLGFGLLPFSVWAQRLKQQAERP